MRVEGNTAVLRILRVAARNGDLVPFPVHVAALNAQHLAATTARLEGADDAVVAGPTYLWSAPLISEHATSSAGSSWSPIRRSRLRLLLCLDRHAEFSVVPPRLARLGLKLEW